MSSHQFLKDDNFTADPFYWIRGENPVDGLLREFERSNVWKVNKSRSHWHEYELPALDISDDQLPDNKRTSGLSRGIDPVFDTLGSYVTRIDQPEREGTIVLYRSDILKHSEYYIEAVAEERSSGRNEPWMKNLTLEEAFKALTTVVFIHELGHWIHHYLIPTGCRSSYCTYFSGDQGESTEVKEAIAQFITKHALSNDNNAISLFNYLIKDLKKESEYRGHEILEKDGSMIGLDDMIVRLHRYRQYKEPMNTIDEFLKYTKIDPSASTINSHKLKGTYGI